jgi:excisionase family DNA binding protein
MSDSDELLDIEQAARFLNVSETSLRRWTNSGRLACLRVGRRRERRFRMADLLGFMESQPAGVTGPGPQLRQGGHTLIDGLSVRHGIHLCGLYASDTGRVKQAAAFLAEGSRPGGVSFLVASPEVREEILASLEHSHPSTRMEVEAGRLVLGEYADSAEAQLVWWEVHMLTAMRAGATSLRAFGDIWGLARHVSREELLGYETAYDQRIARRFPVVTLCQYDARRFSSIAVLDALKAHRDSFQYPAERVLA